MVKQTNKQAKGKMESKREELEGENKESMKERKEHKE
jgi:hypothetical protein